MNETEATQVLPLEDVRPRFRLRYIRVHPHCGHTKTVQEIGYLRVFENIIAKTQLSPSSQSESCKMLADQMVASHISNCIVEGGRAFQV